MPRFRFDQYLVLFLVGIAGLVWPNPGGIAAAPQLFPTDLTFVSLSPIPMPLESEASASASAAQRLLNSLTARSVYVTDEASGAILLEKNANEPMLPASTTKLMTALVARDLYHQGEVMTVAPQDKVVGATMGLEVGEQISFVNLLKGLLIQSGNDAATLLATHDTEGETAFVAAMNQRAQTLDLEQSHFRNSSGLDDWKHVMSARDLAITMREVYKDELLRSIVSTPSATVRDVSGVLAHRLVNTHEWLGTDPLVLAGKTGTTELAGQVLVTRYRLNDHELTVVIMGSQDRYAETKMILSWLNNHYTWVTL